MKDIEKQEDHFDDWLPFICYLAFGFVLFGSMMILALTLPMGP